MDRSVEQKIRILMVLGNTGRGGAQTYAINVLRNIDRTRFQIDFVVNRRHENGYETEMEQLGSKIYIIPKFKGVNYFEYIRRFNEVLDEGAYHIVHGHVSSSAVMYLKAAKLRGCVTIVHSHSAGYRGNVLERIIKRFFTAGAKWQADYWFSCSKLAAERLFGRKYAASNKYHYIPNAIVVEEYRFDESIRNRIRSDLGMSSTDVLYGHVGTFSTPKNHKFLIQVFKELYKKQGEKAHLVLLGEGALKAEIEQEVIRSGLEQQVTFTGNVGNVNEYLMAMDIMIFPSLFEGLPVSLVEAQATGLPCIASDRITDEVNITDCMTPVSLSKSAQDWAEIVEHTCANNRQAYNKCVATTKFNMSNSIHELMELYENMIQDK